MSIAKFKSEFIKKKLPKIVGAYINMLAIFSPLKAGILAMNIFCTPRAGRLKDHQSEFLSKAENLSFSMDSEHIQVYHWKGSGKKVLLVHGWESNAWRWRKLIKELQKFDSDIYALDAPAHGKSGGKYFTGILYGKAIDVVSINIQPQVLIGHSIGAFSSLYYKSHFESNHVEKIIVLASPDKMTDITQTYHDTIGLNRRGRAAYQLYFNQIFDIRVENFRASLFAATLDIGGALIHDKDDKTNFFEDGVAISTAWQGCAFYSTTGHGHSLQSREVYDIVLNELKNMA